MASPLPGPPPQMQPGGMMQGGGMMQPSAGPGPKALLHTAIQALHQYAQVEQDPADQQAALAVAQALQQLAQKDQQDVGAAGGQANYRQGGTAASQFFGPNPRY